MPHHLTLSQMIAQLRSRRISSVELVEAHLRQIDKHNAQLNAFVRVLGSESMDAAKRADDHPRNGDAGPLHGIPVTIKDSFDMEGLPTTCGSRFFAQLRAAHDATAVARFKAAGAIPLGKTNCPEFLANYETDNNVIGRTNNPWDVERTPGGSSGGESAAISAFFSAGGIGSDGGGSIRIPAHFCGIAGLKPTPGRCSAAGHLPEINHPGGLLGVGGPMARTARDVQALFEVLQGYDADDPFSAPVPLRRVSIEGARIGVVEQFYNVPVQPAAREAVRKAAGLLQDAGFIVEPFEPQGLERAPNLWWFFFGQVPSRILAELIAGREDQAHWTGLELVQRALAEPEPTYRRMVDNFAVRDKLRGSMLRQMESCAALLTPACGVSAWPHGQRRFQTDGKEIGLFEAMMPATWLNLLGLPGVVVPMTFDADNMPVGVQLVGRAWDEETILEIAVRLE